MRDSKWKQLLDDIADISAAKLGKEWQLPVMLCAAEMAGFQPVGQVMCDGEIVEITFTKLQRMVCDDAPCSGEPGE